ncbi:MAG: GNAT family N-acetyltransferase [Verrucomicrobiota bacterium]
MWVVLEFIDAYSGPPRYEQWTQETVNCFLARPDATYFLLQGGCLVTRPLISSDLCKEFQIPKATCIDTIFVKPSQQGKGIAKRLLRELIHKNLPLVARTRCDIPKINHIFYSLGFSVLKQKKCSIYGTAVLKNYWIYT